MTLVQTLIIKRLLWSSSANIQETGEISDLQTVNNTYHAEDSITFKQMSKCQCNCGDRFCTSKSDVCRRQNMTSKVPDSRFKWM